MTKNYTVIVIITEKVVLNVNLIIPIQIVKVFIYCAVLAVQNLLENVVVKKEEHAFKSRNVIILNVRHIIKHLPLNFKN